MEAAAATAPPETEATEVSVKLYNKPKTMEAAAATAQPETEDWVCFDNSNDESTTNAPNSVSNKKSGKSSITNNTNTNNNSNNREQSCAAAAAAASSTAYSFTGSALGSGSIANLNETTLKSTTMNNDNTTKPAGNNSGNSKPIIDEEDNNKADDSLYECNICLDTAKDAVVSMCGHLFCWPCLHQWLETRPNRKLCPVCKAAVDKDKVIPLYGRNSVNQEDPRNKVPPRPAGQRTEPEPQQGFTGFGFGDGFHMSFGIGAFPFGFFTSSLNFGEPRPPAANRGTTQYEDDQTLSKLFLYLAFMCIAWLLFA